MANISLNFVPNGALLAQHGNLTQAAKDLKSEAAAAIQAFHHAHGVLASAGDTLELPNTVGVQFPGLIFRIVTRHISSAGIHYEID